MNDKKVPKSEATEKARKLALTSLKFLRDKDQKGAKKDEQQRH